RAGVSRLLRVLKYVARNPLPSAKGGAMKFLPPLALDRYLSLHGRAVYSTNKELREHCRNLLAGRLKLDAASPAFKTNSLQLCQNLQRWTIPVGHPYWKTAPVPHEMIGEEHIRRCLNAGRGAIMLLSHFGPWPFINRELKRRGIFLDPTYPLGWPDELDSSMTSRVRFLLKARRALAAGGVVGLMGDVGAVGYPQLGRMVELPFLGGTAQFPLGGALLAGLASSPLLPLFALRHADGRHALVCTPPIDPRDFAGGREERAVKMLECYAARLEQMIKEYPNNACSFLSLAARFEVTDAGRDDRATSPSSLPA
ncbi:MAG TPA: lysophospholipid acyltransferase family protein, partial [Pyrinomonadaceae bacterium]|nr:lysophospholipid acyltransferase family protein [Pyrinomonadaceae bacterium]